MKKIILVLLLALSGATLTVSCTEEVVTPHEAEPLPPPIDPSKI
jgi:hypothetical protein